MSFLFLLRDRAGVLLAHFRYVRGDAFRLKDPDVLFRGDACFNVVIRKRDRASVREFPVREAGEKTVCRTPKDLTAFPPDKVPVKTGQGFGAEV